MSKKRQSEDSEESNSPAKKAKETEFNGTVFKALLKEPTKAMKGLETFILTAEKLPCPDLYDVVEGYIKISMECAEIFKLLEGEKHMESEMTLIFQSLEMILLRTASDLSHFSMVGTTIVKKAVSSYMKLIQGSLHSENHRFVRQCLSFLSAMVSQGPETARDVFSHVQFNRSLSGLARRKDKMGRPDVRMAYIKFALSFLVSGDNATVGQLLEMKDFLPDILSSGLREDRISIVNLILSTLQTRVVQSKAISKTQKVRFFSPAVLANLASLYRWNGIVDASTEESQVSGSEEDAGKMIMRELVHNFLLDLCCSRKHGISFYDPSLGTAGRAGNIVLLQFLVGLKQATEDELVAELVVGTLKVSPDILPRYFKETQYSFTPRLKSAWHDNVTLLKKIFEAQPEVSKAFFTREFIPLPRLLSMVMVTSLPPVCNKAFFTQGLNFGNTVVQHTTLSLLSFLLRRAHSNMEHCLNTAVWQSSDIYTPAMMDDFVQQYREALSKILPDMTSIVSKWQSLTKKDKGEEGGKGGKKERSPEDKESKVGETAGAESAEVVLLKALILQVICLYQKVVPHLVSQSKFDFSKLLKGIVSEKGMRHEVPPVLQHQILQLALDLPASKFSWFRVQDVADPETGSGEKSVFYLLLKMFVSSTSGHLKTCTRMLVLKVLKDSGVFEYTWTELELWLNHLARLDPAQQDTVIQFLERVLVRLVCNPYLYTDQVASLVQEAAYQQASLTGQDGDAVSIPISHIDDVLDMVDVIMENSEGDMEDSGPSLSDDLILQTFPFSAVVPAVLEARNKLPVAFRTEHGEVYEYVAAVLSDVLHCQRDPLPLCLALLRYDKELGSSEDPAPPHPSVGRLHRYYSRWLPEASRQQLFQASSAPGSDCVSFNAWMAAVYSEGPPALLDAAFKENAARRLSTMETSEFPVAVKQVLLYVRSTVDAVGTFSNDAAAAVLSALMGVLRDLVTMVTRLQSSTEADEPVDGQEGGELFLDVKLASRPEDSKDLTVLAVLSSVFKHPSLEQWFLALELGSVPPHAMNPVRLKRLCGQLSDDVLALLRTCAPCLSAAGGLDVLSGYLGAVERAVLRELAQKPSAGPGTEESRPIRGLLALHGYMEPSRLREVVSALLLLPQESLIAPGDGAAPAELSVYGRAALQVLTESSASQDRAPPLSQDRAPPFSQDRAPPLSQDRAPPLSQDRAPPLSQDRAPPLSQAHLQGLGTLLLSCSSPPLEAYLLRALEGEPGSAKLIHTEVLQHCLERPRPGPGPARQLGSLLLQNSPAHRLRFELWCLEPANAALLCERTEDFLPLVTSYLRTAGRDDPARPKDVQTAVLKQLKKGLLGALCAWALGGEAGDGAGTRLDALASLLKMTAKATDIQDLVSGLPDVLQRAGGFDRWQLVDVVSDVLAGSPEELQSWRKTLLTAALKWLISSYGQFKEKAAVPAGQEEAVLDRLPGLLTSRDDVTASEWNSFVKTGLKYRYRDQLFMSTLTSLLERMYVGVDAPTDLVPLATLHMMASSHSLFLPSMLGSDDLQGALPDKEALVSLLLSLVRRSPAVCNASHLVVLLGAYGATLSTSDQKLLLLLREYERNHISLVEYQSLLWGQAAVDHHKARKSLGASLWQQPSSEDLLSLLDADRMLHTIARFPRQRTLLPQEGKELVYSEDAAKDLGSCYDPCFLLPLFSAMLRPESAIDCFKFVSSHALGLSVVALSSYDPKLRAAAYHVLGCFYQHLEGAYFREKRQLLYLMDTVKNGIRKQNLRLPFVMTSYIAKVAQQMLRPEDHMYRVVNRFLLCHQSLDFRRVPEFFKLFYSSDMEHKMEQGWILGVLEEGLTDRYCYELCDQQGVFQSLLGFSSSPLCDEQTQAQIVRILRQAAHVTKAAYNLTKGHGLLTWALQVVQRRRPDQCVLNAVVDLLHVLWFTNLGQKEEEEEGRGTPPRKCLPLPLINEFLCVSSAIIRHLRRGVQAAQLSLLLHTLSSVLRHRGTALGVHEEAGWLTLRPQALSCTEALSLLHCYASLGRDGALLTRVRSVAEKHQLKELLGTAKDKGHGKGPSSQARGRAEEQRADAEAEPQERSPLAGCEPQLRSIFSHWEPVSPVAGVSQDGLVGATAHLLTKWSLRSLVEEAYDENGTADFLRWFRKVAMPHRTIVDVLLCDPAVKADLLSLYHKAFESQQPSPSSSRVQTLQMFTSIMTHLLEVTGCPSEDLHQTLLTACLTESPQDPSRMEAGLALMSLYIHEMWSGARSPALFLAHVRLVTGAQGNKNQAKRLRTQVAVRDICSDIVQSVALLEVTRGSK